MPKNGPETTPDTTNGDYRETEVGIRYARAAFGLAQDTKALDRVLADLASLKALLLSSHELRTFVASLVYRSNVKLSGLLAVAKSAKLSDLTLKLLGVLAANGRLDQLLPTITAFNRMYAEHTGVVTADVTSAVALTEGQLANLKTTLAQALGQQAQINTKVDPAILGGLKVRVGSRLFDASLKTKLDSLKFALKRA